MTDFYKLLKNADKIVQSKSVFKKFIEGTPLANDISIWMVEFAQEVAEIASEQAAERMKERCAVLLENVDTYGDGAEGWLNIAAGRIREISNISEENTL